ncbi:hypothetical protein [Mariniphaga sp.]|uniref:hypothetical protein n=1 Tax=Mariniphaga sp. TaxID=1954475 RepID=UPI0035662127
MEQSFVHILTLFLRHQYFSDNLFKPIEISLADASKKTALNYGIIAKPFPGGFHLLASNTEIQGFYDEAESLQFFLKCTDANYINYTDLPAHSLIDRMLYFNNTEEIKGKVENGFVLHAEEFAGENELVQVVYEKVTIPDFNSGENYRFTDAAGNEIPPGNITPSAQNSNTFNISNLPQGLILFHAENKDVVKFYHYNKAVWKKPFAVVELFPKQLFNQFKENGKVEYAINFSNRKTVWKYFLVSPVYNKFKNLSIINKGKEEVFNSLQIQQIQANIEALVFESKNKIPLAEQSDDYFQLVDNYSAGNGKSKIVLKNLPRASAEQLYVDEAKTNETFYSHIFI